MSKVVFVGNVPYNLGEAELIDVFRSVGQVVAFRLVFDRDTGKPKGYGFCEFADNVTALSAVRNLNNQEIGGRPLRVDLADSDPFLEGKTTVQGEIIDGGDETQDWRANANGASAGGFGRAAARGGKEASFLDNLPSGKMPPPGVGVLDAISDTLGGMNPGALMDVLAQVKAFVINHPEQARTLLVSQPQLAYALFQALLLYNIVDPAVLQRMLHATTPAAAPPPSAPPSRPQPPPPQQPSQYQQPPYQQQPYAAVQPPYPPYPPMPMGYAAPPYPAGGRPTPPPGMGGPPPPGMPMMGGHMYPPPPPQIQAQPPRVFFGAAPPTASGEVQVKAEPGTGEMPRPVLDDEHQSVLRRVLGMSQTEIDALPASEKEAITVIRNQFLSQTTRPT